MVDSFVHHPSGIGRAARAGLALALACVGATFAPANAALELARVEGSATASANFFGTGLPSATDTESFGPFGGVATAQVGLTRAVQTGSGLNAVSAEGRLGDIPSFALRAASEIEQTVINTGQGPEALAFQYQINGGALRLFSPRGSFDGLEATVAVSIFVIAPDFSGFLWDWGVTLRGDAGSVTAEVHGFAPIFEFSDPLGLGQPDLSDVTVAGGEATLSIAAFTGFVELGDLAPQSSSFVNYVMYGEVSGPGLNNTGGEASLGDPFDFNSRPGSVISIPGALPIPEPHSWALSISGLAVIVIVARRRQRHRGRTCRPG